ncbi:hypothetical protein [Desulfovulcanus sp.]
MDIRAEIASKMIAPKRKERSCFVAPSSHGVDLSTFALSETSFQKDGDFPTFKKVRKEYTDKLEANYLSELSLICHGDVQKACKISGLSRARLYELLKKHGIGLKH